MRVMVEAHSWKCVDARSEGRGPASCWDQAKAPCTSSNQLSWQRPQEAAVQSGAPSAMVESSSGGCTVEGGYGTQAEMLHTVACQHPAAPQSVLQAALSGLQAETQPSVVLKGSLALPHQV